MILFFEILLITICLIIINSFIIYPVVVYLIGGKNEKEELPDYEPEIAILIAARNEEKVITDRIINIAEQNYDINKVEVFVGSDASDDFTNEILTDLQNDFPWLKIHLFNERQGKAGILNQLVKEVNNEILVFTDANTEFHKDTLKNLVQDLQKDDVGGVCGKLVLVDDEKSLKEGVEETSYWKYETVIKRAEGKCGILLSANGGIFAIKRKLFREIPVKKAVTDDLFISLSVVDQGYKFTYGENSIAYENTGKDVEAEYNRKVRFGATNFQTLTFFLNLLSFKRPLISYAFFSHKVSRWFLPHLLFVILLITTFLESHSLIIGTFFYIQLAFYLLAFAGFLLTKIKVRIPVFSLPYFFIISNFAIAEGFYKFLRKEHSVIWNSTER